MESRGKMRVEKDTAGMMELGIEENIMVRGERQKS